MCYVRYLENELLSDRRGICITLDVYETYYFNFSPGNEILQFWRLRKAKG
jgi:hypothetical protein